MEFRKSKDLKGLTFEEHLELAELIYRAEGLINKQIMGLYVSSAGGKAMVKHRANIQGLKSFMDSQLCVDHPERFEPAIYYGVSRRLVRSEDKCEVSLASPIK